MWCVTFHSQQFNICPITRRRDIHINPFFNSVIIYIDKSEVNSNGNISVIILYRPPNTDSTIFMKDMEEMFTILTSENRDIFMIGDFNYDTFKNSIILYQLKYIYVYVGYVLCLHAYFSFSTCMIYNCVKCVHYCYHHVNSCHIV